MEAACAVPRRSACWKNWTSGKAAATSARSRSCSGAVIIAKAIGMSEVVIGLTVIAIGTSLPELATSVVTALRNDADVAFGNVLGSNILNILLVLGVVAMIRPISGAGLRTLDMTMLIGSAVVVYPLMWRGKIVNRWEGAALLAAYAAFVVATLM